MLYKYKDYGYNYYEHKFEAIWRDNDLRTQGESGKYLRHRTLGLIAPEYSSFAVDGRPDLSMVVYNPATPEDAERIRTLINSQIEAVA